jgi:hypothetical protein
MRYPQSRLCARAPGRSPGPAAPRVGVAIWRSLWRLPIRPLTRRRPAPQAPQKAAFVALAAFAAAALISAAPVEAAEVKATICASNPTAKLCLKNSAIKQ